MLNPLVRPLRCVIYTRISRDDTGLGRANDRQEEECRRKAEYKRYEIVEVVADISVSAYSSKDRPGWRRVIDMIKNGEVDVVLAYHLDRVTRSMRDLEELIDLSLEYKVGIDTATGDIELTSDMGRMIARILAAVARQEVERKSARQKLANTQRAHEGKPHTIPTFGYAPGNMEVIPEQADFIVAAAIDVLEGATISSIVQRWKDVDRAPKSSQAVVHTLTNPMYAGLRVHKGEVVGTGIWPVILDMETHTEIKTLLANPDRIKGSRVRQGRTPSTLLGGLATCLTCSQPVKATSAHGVLIYGCVSKHTNTPRVDADALVLAALGERLANPDVLSEVTPATDERMEEAAKQATELRKRKQELAVAFSGGLIDLDQLTAASADLTERLAAADAVLMTSPTNASLRDLDVGTPAVVGQVLDLPLLRKRNLIEAFLSLTMLPVGKGNHGSKERPPIEQQIDVQERWRRVPVAA